MQYLKGFVRVNFLVIGGHVINHDGLHPPDIRPDTVHDLNGFVVKVQAVARLQIEAEHLVVLEQQNLLQEKWLVADYRAVSAGLGE